jgi:hypothetical protein
MQQDRTQDHGERIAVLEASHDSLKQQLEDLHKGQQQILTELTKYKGAIGFATFMLSTLVTCLILAKDWIASHIK